MFLPYGDTVESDSKPWVCWSISLVIFLIGLFELCNLGNNQSLMADFDLFPQQLRNFPLFMGRRLFSIFVSATPLHSLLFVWYLIVFGSATEKTVGSMPFLLLFFVAGLPGDLYYALDHQSRYVPEIGTASTISGLIGIYSAWMYWAQIKILGGFSPQAYTASGSGYFTLSATAPGWLASVCFFIFYIKLTILDILSHSGAFHPYLLVSYVCGLIAGFAAKYLFPPLDDKLDALEENSLDKSMDY